MILVSVSAPLTLRVLLGLPASERPGVMVPLAAAEASRPERGRTVAAECPRRGEREYVFMKSRPRRGNSVLFGAFDGAVVIRPL
jgi:hypothetical protein